MYYNEKRKAITAKYVKTHLDDIKIRVPKGQREKLKAIASELTNRNLYRIFFEKALDNKASI